MMRTRADPLHVGPHALGVGQCLETLFQAGFARLTLSCEARQRRGGLLRSESTGQREDE
jgi:hypothetical protein